MQKWERGVEKEPWLRRRRGARERIRRPFEGVGWGRAEENGFTQMRSVNHFTREGSFSWSTTNVFSLTKIFNDSKHSKVGKTFSGKGFMQKQTWPNFGCLIYLKKGLFPGALAQLSSKWSGTKVGDLCLLERPLWIHIVPPFFFLFFGQMLRKLV